jgi:hypothetical protein
MAEGIIADLWRDFWVRETGTGQQVAQLHDRYMMMIMMTKFRWHCTMLRNVHSNPHIAQSWKSVNRKFLLDSILFYRHKFLWIKKKWHNIGACLWTVWAEVLKAFSVRWEVLRLKLVWSYSIVQTTRFSRSCYEKLKVLVTILAD